MDQIAEKAALMNVQALAFAASYIVVLVVLGIVLAVRVILARGALKVGIGDGGQDGLAQAIRVHGNYSEQTPAVFALLILLPFLGATEWLVHAVGATATVGRILHAIGLSQSTGPSFGRVAGMALTFTALGFGAVALIVLAWR